LPARDKPVKTKLLRVHADKLGIVGIGVEK